MGAFGDFVSKRRQELGMTLRGFAKELDMSPSYVSDIEKGNRQPNEKSLLDSLVRVLKLSSDEAEKLYDLAAEPRNEVAQDVSEYLNENNLAKVALRTAKSAGATEDDWNRFINELKERK